MTFMFKGKGKLNIHKDKIAAKLSSNLLTIILASHLHLSKSGIKVQIFYLPGCQDNIVGGAGCQIQAGAWKSYRPMC